MKNMGEGAILHQLDVYTQVQKYSEEYKFHEKTMKSPLMNYMKTMNEERPHRSPRVFGLVHRKNNDELNLRSFHIPNDYINAVAKGFSLSQNVVKADLSRTKLAKDACGTMIRSLPTSVRKLNFSHNPNFGPENVGTLCDTVFADARYQL